MRIKKTNPKFHEGENVYVEMQGFLTVKESTWNGYTNMYSFYETDMRCGEQYLKRGTKTPIHSLYIPGNKLREDEYVLKIRDEETEDATGFLCKLTAKNELMKSFVDWPKVYVPVKNKYSIPIYLFTETYRSGWKLKDWRFGKSQNWASLLHPMGFSVEIYLTDFLNIVKENVIVNGEISGKFRWYRNTLQKES